MYRFLHFSENFKTMQHVRRNMAHRYHCVVCTTSTQYYGADRTKHAGLHTLSLHLVTATGSQEPNNPGLEQS